MADMNDEQAQFMQRRFYSEYHIEVPIMRWGEKCFVRPCCQVYNEPQEYERLGEMLKRIEAC
jgi:hypothetical protein